MTKRDIKRLKELDIKASNCEHFTSEEIQERNNLEFKRNKQNINMRLSGYDKYYYANQCYKDIESVSINNNQYYGASIKASLLSGGETDFKTFNDKKEMLGFIVGYNEAKKEG